MIMLAQKVVSIEDKQPDKEKSSVSPQIIEQAPLDSSSQTMDSTTLDAPKEEATDLSTGKRHVDDEQPSIKYKPQNLESSEKCSGRLFQRNILRFPISNDEL